jgi:hypothetical protein
LKGDKFCRSNRNESVDLSRNDFINLKALRERKRRLSANVASLGPDDTSATMLLVDKLKEEYNPVFVFE